MHWITAIVQMTAPAAALLRLRTLPGRRYIWFSVFLASTILRDILLRQLNGDSVEAKDRYAYAYLYSEPVIEILWLAIALELYRHVAELYPGLERKTWASFALIAGILGTWATIVEKHADALTKLLLFHRSMATVLVLAIGLISLLFGYFRNGLPRNSVIHAWVMAAYSITQAIGFLMINLKGKNDPWSDYMIWSAVVCYYAWAILLTPSGESRPVLEREFTDTDINNADQQTDQATKRARGIGRGNIGG